MSEYIKDTTHYGIVVVDDGDALPLYGIKNKEHGVVEFVNPLLTNVLTTIMQMEEDLLTAMEAFDTWNSPLSLPKKEIFKPH